MRWLPAEVAMLASMVLSAHPSRHNIGRPASDAEISAWDIAVGPTGKELPPGRGIAAEGARIYSRKCESCHGTAGKGGRFDPLAGGAGTLATAQPVKTIGSYWPYATTVWDYINRATPQDDFGSLSRDEVYALTAYILNLNGIIQGMKSWTPRRCRKSKCRTAEGSRRMRVPIGMTGAIVRTAAESKLCSGIVPKKETSRAMQSAEPKQVPRHTKATVSEVPYPQWPLHSLGIETVAGEPEGSGQVTFQTPDKLISGGVWGCSPGTFELTFGWDEMSYLLEGEVVIEQDGAEPLTVRPGDFLNCPKGTRSRWTVTKACKKVFFLRSPEPMG
jgi:cytochrome c